VPRGLAPPSLSITVARSSLPHPRLILFHISSSSLLRHNATHPAIPSLRCTASTPLCSIPLLVDAAPYPTRSPLREYRWISYTSGLLVSLLSPTFGIISLLLLASTPPHFSDFVPTLTCPVSLRVSYFLSSTPLHMFPLSCSCSPCAPACATTYT
jgi:hypothetical protein